MGAPPPTGTFPTLIWTRLAKAGNSLAASFFRSLACGSRARVLERRAGGCPTHVGERLASQPVDVVREADEEQEEHERDPDRGEALVGGARDRPAANGLDDRERDVAAVERKERQEVQEREREADEREDPQVGREPEVERLARSLDDPDGARDLVAAVARNEPRERASGRLGHAPDVSKRELDG